MPELPEVETMRRGIAGIAGSRIEEVLRPQCKLRAITLRPAWPQLARRLRGRTIADVSRLGKRVVLVLDSAERLVFEPRMTGLVLLTDAPDREHLRLGLALSGGPHAEVWFWDRRGLGVVQLLSTAQYDRQCVERLGPDALAVSADELRACFQGCRQPIKVALLNQARLAGIGNLYAAEILHAAKVHPAVPCQRVPRDAWQRIHSAMLRILRTAIRYEGSTLGDGTYRNALSQAGSYQNHHKVYDRAGETCPACRTGQVLRIVQAQRATFYCPTCQPLRRRQRTS